MDEEVDDGEEVEEGGGLYREKGTLAGLYCCWLYGSSWRSGSCREYPRGSGSMSETDKDGGSLASGTKGKQRGLLYTRLKLKGQRSR